MKASYSPFVLSRLRNLFPKNLGVFSALVLVIGTPLLWASVGGSISGRVADPSGAVVPGATVVAMNTETGIKRTVRTDAAGFYAFPALPIGHYQIEVQKTGFKGYSATGLVINVNSALRVDATLQVGSVSEAVTVSATAVHVETQSTLMGDVIGTSRIMTMPLNGRSYTDLLALQPGVVPESSGAYSSPAVSGGLDAGNLSISGQREGANGFMVNGGYAEEGVSGGTSIVPNLDSIAEFRVITNSSDAEYGNYSGGLINVITKSGTNQFHGDAFDYLRDSGMDTRNYFSPSRGTLHQNEFGATFGGPILHNKVFFFTDYQGQRETVGVDSGLIPVPSAAEKQGDMAGVASELTGTVTGSYWANLLSQQLGYPVAAGEPYYTPGCASTAACVLPGAVIPQRAFSSPASKLLHYIPNPNFGSNFTTSAYPETLGDDKGSTRIDANTRLGMLSGYYFIDNYALINPYGGAPVPGFSTSSQGRAQMFNVGLTKSIGSSSVNELRLVYMRNVGETGVPIGGVGPSLSSLGFAPAAGTGSGYNGGIVLTGAPMIPSIGFQSFSIGANGYGNNNVQDTYEVLDNYSKVIGTHTLKFGGEGHRDELAIGWLGSAFSTGTFSFDGSETGLDFADFLLGAPNVYEASEIEKFHTQSWYYGLYAEDSWRVTPQLTLNPGLRWDVPTPWYEVFGEEETMQYGEQSKVFPGAPKGWVFPGDPGIPKTGSPVRYNNFAPRIGLAYSPKAQGSLVSKLFGGPGKSSIRAAYGIYYSQFDDRYTYQVQGDAPFGNYYSNPVPTIFATPFIDRATGINEGQRFPVVFPPRNVSASNPDNSINWSEYEPIAGSPGWDPSNTVPYAEHYDVSLQRQFGGNTLVTLSYVGTQGHHLLGAWENNPSDPAECLSLSQPSDVLPGTATCGPFAEDGVFYPITGGVVDGTRHPFGAPFGSNATFSTLANSNYNALEATLQHTGRRTQFLAGYTWSKALDNSSSWGSNGSPYGGDMVNFFNPKLSKALSSFDMAQNFVASYTYNLPLEKLWHPNRLTRGWMVSGITHFSTGLPVTLQEYDDRSLLGTSNGGGVGVLDEPNFTPGPLNISNPRSGKPYFNTALFSTQNLGVLGDSSKRFFSGPGLNDWDLALIKTTKLTESKSLQFRAEFFNAFNHAQFGLPVGEILNPDFGFVTTANPGRIVQLSLKFLF
ncbi:MAG: TonB-dependent receptor domain-containing protein [Terriglobia bacterium]